MKQLDENYINNLLGDYRSKLQTEWIDRYIHKPFDPISTHIYIVSEGDNVYADLQEHRARGVCYPETGYIYFRDDVTVTSHLLIHEFIHRLSRNFIEDEWTLGIAYGPSDLFILNEVITEKITSLVTGNQEISNPYYVGIKYINKLCRKIGTANMFQAYFDGDLGFFQRKVGRRFQKFLNELFALVYCSNPCNFDSSLPMGAKRRKIQAQLNLLQILFMLPRL